MKNNVINNSIRQLGLVIILVGLLVGLGGVYQAGAAPPEPETGATALPEPTPGPIVDIRTKLQPLQLSSVESAQADDRVLSKIASPAGVNPELLEHSSHPAVTISAKLQPWQTSGQEPSQAEGRLIKEAPLLSTMQETPIVALAQQTFLATADATILQGYASQNFGATGDMWAGYDDSLAPDGKIVRSLIKFNIASLPSNQTITKATLRVDLVGSWDYPNTYRTITTYRITSNWSENNLTWNNKPGYGQSYGSKSIRNDDFKWHEFDVTDLVAAWYNGTYTNHGIMLRGPEISGIDSSWRSFSTSEGPNRPQLVVEYGAPPDPPSNLAATAVSDSRINLSWQDNSTNETGFKIERSLNGVSGWVQIATVGANVTTDSNIGLTCDTTYYYRVRAYNGFGNSAYSNVANAKTSACPTPIPTPTPIAPSNLTATAVSTSQISLSWQDNSSDEDGFKIERSPDGANWTQIATAEANDESYLDTGLECDTTYFYRVRAHNANGNSEYSNTNNATTSTCSYDIYLPVVLKSFPLPPTPTPIPTLTPIPTSTQTPLSELDGNWTGTTSQGKSISFMIVNRSFTSFTWGYKIGGCSATGTTTLGTPQKIVGNTFVFIPPGGSGVTIEINGTFNSNTSATGTISITGTPCGNSTATWTATKQ